MALQPISGPGLPFWGFIIIVFLSSIRSIETCYGCYKTESFHLFKGLPKFLFRFGWYFRIIFWILSTCSFQFFLFWVFLTVTFYRTGLLVQRPTPNLEDQVSVFMTPGDRVSQLYPQTLGTNFSRLLRHAWATVGLLFNPGHHTG
jgi:hypothetical protein